MRIDYKRGWNERFHFGPMLNYGEYASKFKEFSSWFTSSSSLYKTLFGNHIAMVCNIKLYIILYCYEFELDHLFYLPKKCYIYKIHVRQAFLGLNGKSRQCFNCLSCWNKFLEYVAYCSFVRKYEILVVERGGGGVVDWGGGEGGGKPLNFYLMKAKVVYGNV